MVNIYHLKLDMKQEIMQINIIIPQKQKMKKIIQVITFMKNLKCYFMKKKRTNKQF
jgi:hypothetical protein